MNERSEPMIPSRVAAPVEATFIPPDGPPVDLTCMPTTTLADFLLARIAEDEAVAESALHLTRARWWVDGPGEASGKHWVYAIGEKFADRGVAEHVARHDPGRVLAECAAKRAIVAAAQHSRGLMAEGYVDYAIAYEQSMKMLARVYADHEDFHPAWAARS